MLESSRLESRRVSRSSDCFEEEEGTGKRSFGRNMEEQEFRLRWIPFSLDTLLLQRSF